MAGQSRRMREAGFISRYSTNENTDGVDGALTMMAADFGDLMTLIKEGRLEEARALVEAQKAKVRFAPDTISVIKGTARFTKKGKPVERGEDGNWRLKQSRTGK